MSASLSRVEELIALSTRLAALIEDDVATLRGKRPSHLIKTEADRSTATLLYGKAVAEFKSSGTAKTLSPLARQRLNTATTRLHAAIKEQSRLLTRFRHVTEGLIKAVADVVIARETPSTYAKNGAVSRAGASYRGTAMTFDQAV